MAKQATKPKSSPSSVDAVGIKELKDQASAIVERVQKTRKPVVITKNHKEIARIVPISNTDTSVRQRLSDLGMLASGPRLSLSEDLLEDVKLDSSVAIAAIRSDRDDD